MYGSQVNALDQDSYILFIIALLWRADLLIFKPSRAYTDELLILCEVVHSTLRHVLLLTTITFADVDLPWR